MSIHRAVTPEGLAKATGYSHGVLAVPGGAAGDQGGIDGLGGSGVSDLLGVPPQPLLDDEHDPEEDGRKEDGDLDGRHLQLVFALEEVLVPLEQDRHWLLVQIDAHVPPVPVA